MGLLVRGALFNLGLPKFANLKHRSILTTHLIHIRDVKTKS